LTINSLIEPARSALISRRRIFLLASAPAAVPLEGDAEFAAVVQHRFVRVGNAPWTDVDVLPFVERADLALAAHFGVLGTLSDRPLKATDAVTRLEHLVVVAELAQFIADDHARQAAAENEDLGLWRASTQLGFLPGRAGHQIPRGHCAEDERRPAHGAELFKESPACKGRQAR
jgi:hypothetical protein